MAATPEGAVKKKIKAYLTSIHAYHFSPIGGAYSTQGVPDIIICWRGHFVGIEVKAPGKQGNTTPNQDRQIELINKAGGLAFVAQSVADVYDGLLYLTKHANKIVVEAA